MTLVSTERCCEAKTKVLRIRPYISGEQSDGVTVGKPRGEEPGRYFADALAGRCRSGEGKSRLSLGPKRRAWSVVCSFTRSQALGCSAVRSGGCAQGMQTCSVLLGSADAPVQQLPSSPSLWHLWNAERELLLCCSSHRPNADQCRPPKDGGET